MYPSTSLISHEKKLSDENSFRIQVIGKETMAVKGQIVRHIEGGKHVAAQCDRDYLSGGSHGVILDVCGDYAQVRLVPLGSIFLVCVIPTGVIPCC